MTAKEYPEYPRTGRWSNLRTRFLEENRPEELEQMRENGTLTDYMNNLEDEYNERFNNMEEEQLKATQLQNRYGRGEIGQMEFVGEFNQIRARIYELLTEEICQ